MIKRIPLIPIDEIYNYKIKNGRIDGPLGSAPVVVSNGVGVDSVAMLIEMARLGVVPDAVVTAMVGRDWFGNEHRRFYSFLPLQQQWLTSVGFPDLTSVWYEMKRKAMHFQYLSLAGNCLSNRTLPSIAFRRNKSCSLKHKGREIDRWVTQTYGDTPCYRLIGFDCTEESRNARFSSQKEKTGARANDLFIHPLQYWGFTRQTCMEIIEKSELPFPGKSSCVFCSSMKPYELDELYPDELWRIVIIEAHAQINLKKHKGLWTKKRMTDYIVQSGLLPANLVSEAWAKWSAEDRPPELRDNPDAVADQVLFDESRKLAEKCGFFLLSPAMLGRVIV